MFVLSVFQDGVRVPPAEFAKDQTSVVESVVTAKYANKVVRNVGLCIMLYDISKVGDPFIFPGDGASHVEITFRMVVFRPHIGEILTGTIRSCNEDGIEVSMKFFDDILIPATTEEDSEAARCMQPNTRFDSKERLWVWQYGDNELFLDEGEQIRFRVAKDMFTDTHGQGANPEDAVGSAAVAPYQITASINDFGLGCTSWWS